ncbi:hypothetical protein B0A49_08032 [Cryomyces minteri]|uniref:Histone chaperone RTT106/FACT complex subunit SPT16-like middle domain-containing protein n=1 Tax=Cryomyces minteri TaxID=331657 RepID=A0A4U0XDQ5_9PEZI|nr:hypothetical protein B0A49_08032 [Cryomyces minteri]
MPEKLIGFIEADVLDYAYSERPDLRKRVDEANDGEWFHPKAHALIKDLTSYISELKRRNAPREASPPSKKRKLANGDGYVSQGGGPAAAILGNWRTAGCYYSAQEISFQIPQRKKLTLELVPASPDDESAGGLRGANTEKQIEFGIAWRDIDQVFCLPVPEKAVRQHNFVVFPKHSNGVTSTPLTIPLPVSEQMLWTMPEQPPKTVMFGAHHEAQEGETYVTATVACLNEGLKQFGKRVVSPDEREFASAIVQSHRKGEKAFHVANHRGNKDGFLFFLSCGIVWGFKKPLAYFAFDTISSISYTSVLQRTFNLNIATISTSSRFSDTDASQEFEFGMLDQADFAGIDAYIKRHNLNDASMAAQRRAKKLNINPSEEKSGAVEGGGEDGEDGEGETELQKAEREMQDREDEEEEDYDPGSEGESEGEGGSSEEEADGGGDGGTDGEEMDADEADTLEDEA